MLKKILYKMSLNGVIFNGVNRKKVAFTLAEVLITLGIIGVVAAMTLPTLITKHQKKVTVTRMQKFYTSMNQAIKMAEVKNGEYSNWSIDDTYSIFNSDYTYNWWIKYIAPEITSKEIEKISGGIMVALADGSAVVLYTPCSNSFCPHVYFSPSYKNCKKQLEKKSLISSIPADTRNLFSFYITNGKLITYSNAYGILSRDELMNGNSGFRALYGCKKSEPMYCSGLIQYDGWQIKDDYPW